MKIRRENTNGGALCAVMFTTMILSLGTLFVLCAVRRCRNSKEMKSKIANQEIVVNEDQEIV